MPQTLEDLALLAVQRTKGNSDNVTAIGYFSRPPSLLGRMVNFLFSR